MLENNRKILIVTEYFYPEEFKINEVAISWIEKGFEVAVLTLIPTYPIGKIFQGYKNNLINKSSYKGINVYRILTVTGYQNNAFFKLLKYFNFMVLGCIAAVIIGRKYDYVFGYNLGALTDMLPAILIRKIYRKPVFLWVQDLWPDSVYAYGYEKTKILSFILEFIVRLIYRNVTSIMISSKGFESKLKPYVKKDLIFNYLPNWADSLNIDLEAVKLSTDSRVHFTFAGNIGKMQNLENIINAYSSLSDLYKKKSQLNIIGEGSNSKHLKILSKNNKHIIFHGSKPRKDMAKYYKASNFLIISLNDEPVFYATVPAKTQTYIAAKKPILAFINGETADIIKDYNLGLYANPSDIESIRKVFEESIDMSDDKKDELVKNCDLLQSTIFNKKRIIENMTNILVNS